MRRLPAGNRENTRWTWGRGASSGFVGVRVLIGFVIGWRGSVLERGVVRRQGVVLTGRRAISSAEFWNVEKCAQGVMGLFDCFPRGVLV